MKKLICCAMLASILVGGDYTLDKTHSQVGFSIKHLGISNVKGYFKNFDGEYSIDEKSAKFKKLMGTVEIDSINTDVEKRDNHLKSADFFDTQKFPKMTFVMTKYSGDKKKGKMSGNITIRNITKPITFDVEIGGFATDHFGTQKSSFVMNGKINRKDFGLNWNKVMEAGGFVVGEDVKINIEIEGNIKE
jgi:polyisoprenoid-binding protein YceI